MEESHIGQDAPPRVFISYSRESDAHSDRVLELANTLRGRGIDCWLDQFETSPGVGWPLWMEQEIEKAQKVLVVCTPTYLARVKHQEPLPNGKGVRWESRLISSTLYRSGADTSKFIPVLFDADSEASIPEPLSVYSRLRVDTEPGIEGLLREIRGEAEAEPVPIGTPLDPKPRRWIEPVFNAPSPTQHFVGRTRELDELAALLSQDLDVAISASSAATSTSVHGLAGIGKTELVLRLAERLASSGEFPGGIYWLNAENPDLTTEWARPEIAGSFGFTEGNVDEIAAAVVARISSLSSPSLVILDNVTEWSEEPQCPGPLPRGSQVRRLMTTRLRRLGGTTFRPYRLGFLDAAASRELLLDLAGRNPEPGVDDLLEFLDGHALAVELAGVYIEDTPGLSAQSYLAKLGEGVDLIEAAGEVRYQRTVDQALAQIWASLEEPVREAWRVAAQFASELAGLSLSEACGLDIDMLRALRKKHLILFDDDRWRMHRVVQMFGCGEHAGEHSDHDNAAQRFAQGCAGFVNGLDRYTGHTEFLSELAHVQEAVAGASVLDDASRGQLFADVALHLSGLGQHEVALAAAERAVVIYAPLAELRPEAFLPDLARSLNSLGITLGGLGQHEAALAPAERAFEIRETLAEQRPEAFLPDVAGSVVNLGNRLSALGQHEAALAQARRAVEIYEQLAEQRPDAFLHYLALSLNNVGKLLSDLGKNEAALAPAERAVEIYEPLAEQRPEAFLPDLAVSLNNLGSTLSDLGQHEVALAAIERAVEICEPLAEQRPEAFLPQLAMSLNNLGNRLSSLGQHEAALAPIERSVEIREQLAEQRPEAFLSDLASSVNNLSIMLRDLGQHDAALTQAERAVRALARHFVAMPRAHAHHMQVMLRNYLERSVALEREPDQELITPILAALKSLQEDD